jgi:hypothetical protein
MFAFTNNLDDDVAMLDGYAVRCDAVDQETVRRLADAITDGRHARRDLLNLPGVRQWLATDAVRSLIEPHLGPAARPVRGILFDKTATANWKVAWHQDRSIAVRERRNVAGFGPWSVKEGIVHVQPPIDILARMLTLRLHLDDCDETNGPLRVIPGSHHDDILSDAAIAAAVAAGPVVTCCMPAGGALLMRPLLLHASSPAKQPRHRRVIHVEFSADELPGGLAWAAPQWHGQLARGAGTPALAEGQSTRA